MVYLYHCLILVGGLSTSINFLLIIPFIPLLNFFINIFPLYLLPLTALLNSCTNSFIVFPSCSILLSGRVWPILYFLLQILSLFLTKISLLTWILLLLVLNSLTNSSFIHLPILSTHMMIFIKPTFLLVFLLFSFLSIIYMLWQPCNKCYALWLIWLLYFHLSLK